MKEEIIELTAAEASYVEPIKKLLAQLTSSPVVFTEKELQAIVADSSSHLFLLCVDGEAVGMLTLCSYLAPTGRKYWVEDVVVDSAMRGRSYGRRLLEHAMEWVAKNGSGVVMLTSKPARVAANALYRSVGFEQKVTNVYRKEC